MIFILKTYTTTSIEYNVIQLMLSKDMAAQPRQVSNLIALLSTVYIPSANLGENTIRSTKPYSNRMMLALAIGNISWTITFWTFESALRLKVFKCVIVTHFMETAFSPLFMAAHETGGWWDYDSLTISPAVMIQQDEF